MKHGQKVYLNSQKQVQIHFPQFFLKFSRVLSKIGNYGQICPKIPHLHTQSTTPKILMSNLAIYSYHKVKNYVYVEFVPWDNNDSKVYIFWPNLAWNLVHFT